MSSDIVVRARSITCSYGHAPVLEDVDLEVRRGEIVGLLGHAPSDRVQIVIEDETDFANGWALTVPYNTVHLNAVAPVLTMFFLTTYGMLNISAGIEKTTLPPRVPYDTPASSSSGNVT